MPCRISLIFKLTTEAAQAADASARTGGWSEGFWAPVDVPAGAASLLPLYEARRAFLPKQASIIGVRCAKYTIEGNKLLPNGTSAAKFQKPGNAQYNCDIPQMNLDCSATAFGAINTTKIQLRGIVDTMVQTGEYTPTSTYKGYVQTYLDFLKNQGFGFVARDLSVAKQKVMSIAVNVVTLKAPIVSLAVGDNMIFNHVVTDEGAPVKGSYVVTVIAGNTVTLAGFPATTMLSPSGTARKDMVAFYPFGPIFPSAITIKKIGRPSQGYRGRGSKKK